MVFENACTSFQKAGVHSSQFKMAAVILAAMPECNGKSDELFLDAKVCKCVLTYIYASIKCTCICTHMSVHTQYLKYLQILHSYAFNIYLLVRTVRLNIINVPTSTKTHYINKPSLRKYLLDTYNVT